MKQDALKFASRSLEPGVGASAGIRTVGGDAAVMANQKRNATSVMVAHCLPT